MFTDSHCHINADDFALDRDEVVARARKAGVEYILDVSDDIKATPTIIKFCQAHNRVYTTVGVHPEIADKYCDISAEEIIALTDSPYVVGIGECGLDYFYNGNTKDIQIRVLKEHIKAAQKSLLPLIIHNRDADEDMMGILDEMYRIKPFKGELHCFSSSEQLADFALKLGFYVSASGIITFKNSDNLRNIFKKIPAERLLIETDAPFLAPVPQRGKRNEPAFVIHTAEILASIRNVSVEDLAKQTTDNFFNLFCKILR